MNWRWVIAALAVAPMSAQRPTGVVVQGMVRNAATRAGLEGAAVELRSPRALFEGVTDAQGRFRFANVPPGRYSYGYRKEGFAQAADARLEEMMRFGGFQVGGVPLDLEWELAPFGGIAGKVLLPDGEPAAGVEVTLSPQPDRGGTVSGRPPVTDARGEYRFDSLPPDRYYVRAAPVKDAKATSDDSAGTGPPVREAVVASFFPGVIDGAEAQRVVVRPGVRSEGNDFRLQMARLHRLRGRVVDVDGKPVAGTWVTAQPVRAGAGARGGMSFGGEQLIMQLGPVLPVTESHEALSAADGSFVLEDLMEGDWAIRAVMEDPDSGAQRQAASETVHVGRQGAPEPELRLQRSFEMTVTLDWGETPPASGLVHFTFQGANGPAVAEQAEPPTVGKAPLALRYRNVTPGYYQLSATLTGIPNSHYLAAVKQGGRDVLGQPILLAPTSAPLSIVMKPSPGAIAATVEVLKDRVRPAVVLLWKAGPPMGESDWVRMAAASTEGRAAFGGLAPGPYNLAAFDRTELQQITATLLNSLAPTAKRVEVVAGANTPVELKAQRWPE